MAQQERIYPILTEPGIKRDGTVFQGNFHVDALWTRWQRGLARKMGGYRQMSAFFSGICRGCRMDGNSGFYYTHAGSQNVLEQSIFDAFGVGSAVIDRTPSGFATSANNVWQLDVQYDQAGTSQILIAHAAQNLGSIDNQLNAPVYYGDVFGTAALTAISGASVSGGCVVFPPYLFLFGHDGFVQWSVPNDPTDLAGAGSGEARVTGGKIVKGFSSRGGSGNAPAGLLFATDAIVRTTFVGGTPIFNFDRTTHRGYSVLSPRSIVEYDGVFYWPGINRFLYFDGVIRELPNDMSLNYFFDNLNKLNTQKVYGQAFPRYGEIWWPYPRGEATECTHAIVFNVREKTWYDTPLPEQGRSDGYTDSVFQWPIMFGVEQTSGKNQLWQHDYGVDKQVNSSVFAVRSFYETADISFPATGITGNQLVGEDRNILLTRIEPDFIMSGDMTVTPIGRAYAQSPTIDGRTYTFNGSTEKIDMREQFREMRLRFESNQVGGDYQAGQTLLKTAFGDGRP